MLITLKPLAPGQHAEIRIEEALFPLGRSEPCFADYDSRSLAFLSRRHARIFSEHGKTYVADLGSRNGTQLNNRKVEFKPERLRSGDELSLANTLRFEVCISDAVEDSSADQSPPPPLTLLPASPALGDRALTITDYPFLVGNAEDNPIHTGAENGEPRKFLSRRHAHFFVSGDDVFLEDLGSTNGTFVNNDRLTEDPVRVASGDMLQFGSPHCRFEARLEGAEGELAGADGQEHYHTAFVSAADSFLNIFCVDEQEEEVPLAEPASHMPGESDKPAPTKARKPKRGFLHRFGTFFRELKGAFSEPTDGKKSHKLVLSLVAVTTIAIALLWVTHKDQHSVEALLEQQQYRQALELADTLLADQPKDKDTQELALKALLSFCVQPWLAHMETGRYEEAALEIATARGISTHLDGSTAILDLLDWITQADQYFQERGGTEAPIQLFEHEARILELLAWWDQDAAKQRALASVILDHVPAFEGINMLTFSYVRALKNDESVYIAAIEKLKLEIENRLAEHRAKTLLPLLDQYQAQYPRLAGLSALRTDVQRFLPVETALVNNTLQEAWSLIRETTFETPFFQRRIQELQAKVLPPPATTNQLEAADNAWRSGNFDRALTLMEQLAAENKTANPALRKELQRRKNLVDDYQKLSQDTQAPDYTERLIAYYSRLDEKEDAWLRRNISADVNIQSSKMLQRATGAWNAAESAWNAYRGASGIGGILRLEETVSQQFRTQAQRLQNAHENAARAQRIYDLLAQQPPEDRVALAQRVAAEIELQRRSLEQLSMVLGDELLNKKLALLGSPASN